MIASHTHDYFDCNFSINEIECKKHELNDSSNCSKCINFFMLNVNINEIEIFVMCNDALKSSYQITH